VSFVCGRLPMRLGDNVRVRGRGRVRARVGLTCSRCSALQLGRASPAAAAESWGLHCACREVLGGRVLCGDGCCDGCGCCGDGTCT